MTTGASPASTGSVPDQRERAGELRQRVADELHSTFASHYSDEVSLLDVLQADVVAEYSQQATGKKYLINPSL